MTRFLRPEQCCLHIIDPQERLMAHIHEAEQVIHRIGLMIHLARTFDMAMLANTQYRKGIGPVVPELRPLLEGIACVDKVEFNALASEETCRQLDLLDPAVDTLILCGVETHICVYQTALGALEAGYRVWVVADGVSSRDPVNDRLGRRRMRELGVVVVPAEMIVYELLQRAGTEEFKTMLPHLK